MSDPEVERAAEFLAAHAVLLLGVGTAAVLLALAAVILAVRVVARYQQPLRRSFLALVGHAQKIAVVDRMVARTRNVVPSGYLALHLALGLVLTVAATVFVIIAEQVAAGGELAAFDLAFARALQDDVTPGWKQVFTVVSAFGSGNVLAAAAVILAVDLLVRQGAIPAAGWMAAQGGGGLLNVALKETFERTRPESADPLLAMSSFSFPSGHAMGTFILCGLGCYLVIRDLRSWTTAVVVVVLSVLWCVVMAFSRMYLGVHYASDVMAGLFAGAAWVAVCISGFEVIRRSRRPKAE